MNLDTQNLIDSLIAQRDAAERNLNDANDRNKYLLDTVTELRRIIKEYRLLEQEIN